MSLLAVLIMNLPATYANNWAEYLVQLIGPQGAIAILTLLWVDSTVCLEACRREQELTDIHIISSALQHHVSCLRR